MIEILSLSKTTCQSGDEVAGFPSPWRQGHINWFPPCEASSFMGSKHFDKNVLKSQETYDWFLGMLYLCNVVQERITFAQNIPSAHRHGQLLSKSQVTPH